MRKGLTTLLVILLAVGAMLVSCKAEVGTPADELVAVSFEMNYSRSLTATLEKFKPETYFWKYAAKKNAADTSGLTSGTTTSYDADGAKWVKGTPATTGLAGAIVPGFSQGLWDFTLYAYKDAAGTELVYLGEATAVTLVKGEPNMVHVVVSPAPAGTGTLFIDSTPLDPKKTTDNPTVSRFLKVEDLDGTEYTPTTGTTYKLDAGAYKVTVTYKASGIVYAEGTVMATIYPNMTTTVSGSVDELVTYAQFEAEQNPDIIARTAGVDGITSTTTGDDHGNINLSEPATVADKKVSATVPAAAAVALLPKVGEDPDPNASMSLELNVDTTDSTSTSVTYDISMTKIVTLDSEVTTSDVETLGTDPQTSKKYYAVATVKLSSGLTGVKVTHDGHDMIESTDTKDDKGYGVFFYDATTGILTIQTNTFSPFKVTYDGETAGVAELNGKKYATLVAACEALPQGGGTITLLCDAEGAGLFLPANFNMTIVLDLKGHTYTCTGPAVGSTGTATQALHLEKNNNVTAKNGKITSTPDSGVKMLVQNYCDLTLEDVILDGSNIGAGRYTLSNNCGNVSIKGKTDIYAPTNGRAFDVCGYSTYSAGVSVNVATTGTISGKIEIDEGDKDYPLILNISNGTFLGSIVGTAKTSTEEMEEIISITGGVYNYDPSAYVAEGCEVRYNETTKLWTVMSPGEIARELAIKAGANPDTIVVYTDYAHGTLTDMVVYRFYADGSVYIVDAKDYNGWDGSSTDATKFTVGKLLAVKGMSVDGMLQGSFKENSTISTIAFACDISYAYKAFEGNNTITSVDCTNLTIIPNRLFYDLTRVEEIVVPDSVTRVEDYAFYACTGVKTVIIGENVEYIGYKAFDGCSSLETLDICGSPEIVNWAGRGCTALKDLYLRGEKTTYNMTYAPKGQTVGDFVIAKGQSGNPDTFGFTVHVATQAVFDELAANNGTGSDASKYTAVEIITTTQQEI